jgi:hypothetical protein
LLCTLAATGCAPILFGRPARAVPAMAAEPFPDGLLLLVAGPSGSPADEWATLLAPELSRVLPVDRRIRTLPSGGTDGVTAANQFDARAEPDGSTVLILTGATVTAWLVGDSRAHFDVGQWVPVFSALTHAVLCARGNVTANAARGRPVRIAAASPTGPELPALLALDLLGLQPVPVFGLQTPQQARDALRDGAVDAVLACGRGVADQVAALRGLGAPPAFSLGLPDDTGRLERDPAFPDVPTFGELLLRARGTLPSGGLFDGWRAAALASQLDAAAVLPQLTPAGMVALWRRGCDACVASPAMQAAAAAMSARPMATPGAALTFAAIAPDATALLELRRWLALRFNWRPA